MSDFTLPFKQSAALSGTSFEIDNTFASANPVPGGAPFQPVPPTIVGVSVAGAGISGQSGTSNGVSGQCGSSFGAGVAGLNNSGGPGVSGSANGFDAVSGISSSDAHAGVAGHNTTTGKNGGVGVYGTGGQYAGKFDGDVMVNGCIHANNLNNPAAELSGIVNITGTLNHTGDANVSGTMNVGKDILLSASDCAEDFDLQTSVDAEPGDVMVLNKDGELEPNSQPYDKRVTGVISGAGAYRPGLILGRYSSSKSRAPIALVGKVYCKVDAQYGRVEVGDLLTTSPTRAHAMKAGDPVRAFGAVIGKALQCLPEGRGLLPVLVALQ